MENDGSVAPPRKPIGKAMLTVETYDPDKPRAYVPKTKSYLEFESYMKSFQ